MFLLNLLGGATLEGPDGPLSGPPAQRHRLALLAVLACSPGLALGREKLLGLLWPEADTGRARRLLTVAVHAIRSALGQEVLLTRGTDLRLNPARLRVDVLEFRAALAAGDLAAAVALYGGPFLDGFFLDDAPEWERWADAERDRLASRRLLALEELARQAEGRGDTAGAVEWWTRASGEDPFCGRLAAGAMRALAAAGDRAGALRVARTHAARILEEFGTEPDEEVRRLAAGLRSETPAPAPLHPPPGAPAQTGASAARGAPPSELPLVGRARELEMIGDLLGAVGGGEGRLLTFHGTAGVGKSRLLRAAALEAERRGFGTVWGRSYPVAMGVPYGPFSEALTELAGRLGPEATAGLRPDEGDELALLAPSLGARAPAARPAEERGDFKSRLLWAVHRFLARCAERRPLLLLLEDLHWADPSSLELLHFLVRQPAGARIGFVCTVNDEQRGGSPALLAFERSVHGSLAARAHAVQPLSPAECEALVEHACGAAGPRAGELAPLVFARTRGNPFFVEETLKVLAAAGRLSPDPSLPPAPPADIELAPSIRDALAERLGTLSAEARSTAELLAVLGRRTPHRVLAELSGRGEAALVADVDELRTRAVVEEVLDGAVVVYDFAHPMLRDALYGALGLARTRLLHGAVAAALERVHGDAAAGQADELAFHLVRADSPDLAARTVHYLVIAGRDALSKYADREAAAYLQAALDRARASGLPVGDALVPELARARQRLGDFDGAIALWGSVRDAAAAAGNAGELAAAEHRIGSALRWSGRIAEGIARYDAALAAATPLPAPALEARLRLSRGEALQELGRPEEARQELVRALSLAERSGEGGLTARAHLALLLLHTWVGPPSLAASHGARALDALAAAPDPALECTLHWGLAVLASLTGDAGAAPRHVAECERLAERLASPLHRLRAAELAIELASNTGEWGRALEIGEWALALARALNQRVLLPRLLVWIGIIRLGRGELEAGRALVDEAWELAGAGGAGAPVDVHTAVPAHCGRAAWHVAAGEFETALGVARAGLAIADRSGYAVWAIHRLLPLMAEAHLSMGDVEGAAAAGARLRGESERLGHQLGLAWADACDALLVWLRGDMPGGIERLRAAAERLEAVPAVPDAARLRRHFAARLRDHGDRAGALAELRRVHEVFARLGATRELEKTRGQIRELGARPPGRAAPAANALSERETEIVRMIAEGRSNKAIARLLQVSPRTVGSLLSKVFRKLGVRSRREAAERAGALRSGAAPHGGRDAR